MRHLLLLILILFSFKVSANFDDLVCTSHDNESVEFVVSPTLKVGKAGHDENGFRYIILDPSFIEKAIPEAIRLVYFHECGHHQVNPDVLLSLGFDEDYIEFSADCYSRQHIIYNYGIGYYRKATFWMSQFVSPERFNELENHCGSQGYE